MADYCQIFASDRVCFNLTPSMGWSPANIWINFTWPKARMIVLPDAGNGTIVSSFVWTKHRNVTEGETDGRTESTDGRTDHAMAITARRHCKQCGRAVKTKSVWPIVYCVYANIASQWRSPFLWSCCRRRLHLDNWIIRSLSESRTDTCRRLTT